jgi:hypothetical protein
MNLCKAQGLLLVALPLLPLAVSEYRAMLLL